ncbi:MAG: hypothetical protein WCQ00_03355 [bacterium]
MKAGALTLDVKAINASGSSIDKKINTVTEKDQTSKNTEKVPLFQRVWNWFMK